MKRKNFLLISLLLIFSAYSSINANANDSIKSVSVESLGPGKLKNLSEKYIANGQVDTFWQEVEKVANAGAYPFVEPIENSSRSPSNYVRLTFLHKAGEKPPENILLFSNINHVVPEELLFSEIDETGIYFKTVEVPRGVRFHYRIIENDPLTGLFAGAKYGTRFQVLGGGGGPRPSQSS